MKTNILKIGILCLLMCMAACQTNPYIAEQMNRAEACMDQHPDSALNILRSISYPDLQTAQERARHALLHSQVLDKNYIDLTTDSIIRPAVEYYLQRDEVRPRFLTLYYKGRIHQNAKQYPEAIIAFTEAELLIDQLNDDYYAGLLLHAMAQIYDDYMDFQKRIEYNRLAGEHFARAGKQLHYLYTQLEQANAHWSLNEFDTAIRILETVINESDPVAHASTLRNAKAEILRILIDDYRWEEARKHYDAFCQQYDFSFATAGGISDIAIFLAHEGDIQQAYRTMDMAWAKCKDRIDSVKCYHAMYQIYEKEEKHKQAHETLAMAVDLQNKEVRKTLEQPILTSQVKFLRQDVELQKYKRQLQNTWMGVGAVAMLVAISAGVYVLVRAMRRRQGQMEAEKSQLQDRLETLHNLHEQTESQKNDLFESKMKELDKLVLISLKEYTNEANRERAMLKLVQDIKKQYCGNKKNIQNLEQQVNKYKDNVMQHLRDEITLPGEPYYEQVCYQMANFSVSTIALLMDETPNTIYKRRERIRSLIQQSSAPHKEQFLQI